VRPFGTLEAEDPKRRCRDLRWTGHVDGDLDATERAVLHAALDADNELERDTAFLVTGLSRVGLDRVFVRALAHRLAGLGHFDPPARAVLQALEDTIAVTAAARAAGGMFRCE
jgi:anti-sigma factor RsiW